MNLYLKNLTVYLIHLFQKAGMSPNWAETTGETLSLILLFLFSYIIFRLTWSGMKKILIPVFRRSRNQFDDLLVKHRLFRRISYLVPTLILYYFAQDSVYSLPVLISIIQRTLEVTFVVIIILVIDSLLSTLNDYYNRFEFSKDHPITGLIQIVKIIIYFFGLLFAIATLLHRDLSTLFVGLGTLSAILMLIFRDPILGFVGGLQLTFNKMIRIGDWISMPQYHADGTVMEITLTTIKIQNWDKTIVTVPTYSLVSNSFQNWRGMEEAGGRRIKRAVYIDMDSVHFVTQEELEKFKEIKILKPYLEKKEKEIQEYNQKFQVDPSVVVNGRRQTNLGIFRAYLKAYLQHREDIRKDMTFLVRQLPPSEKGIPIEIYVFTKTTAWAEYEDIQADIFDLILAVLPEFGLRVYQFPKSGDLAQLGTKQTNIG
ncbi:mechanosensitive ion channel family protein [Candidatus Sulfidibacterium hydrothermale]|uniref:mechanosensitive ion channel family protein n=1 Tax=Candidatus Sulfidibacterium hydrothermale TaxID=2875962 RepID=UPI001F0A392D|nr:mechanosensitive ion channel domain-containing protein [Candidatus Sulfidibacterium hydrothermale]UBM61797.1 mechanosensitive ion channel family protein [Candidatus Sulfidibacterium hydrothermale]